MNADDLRALSAAATPGPWGWRGNDNGAVELSALHSGYRRVLTTVPSEPCIIYTEAEGLIVTDEACDDCRAEASKARDPFDGYHCPKEANLGTIWLQDLDAHVIRPANTWAVREVPYRSDVVAVDHPDAELIVWLRNHVDALAGLIDALEHIADGRMCTVVVDNAPPSSWCRNVSSRSRDSRYGATRWCDACIARDAIAALEADR